MRWLTSKGSWMWLSAMALCAWAAVSASADVIYVKADATGNNDGTSWEDAFVYLQDALVVVEAGDEIWVAAGEYRPDQGENQTPGDRESSFEIAHAVSLYGGFDGTEETLEERAGLFEQTILSGDLEGDDEPGFVNVDDNSYTVVRTGAAEVGEIVIDGFRIRGGNADLEGGQGAGMFIDAPCTVRNSTFEANRANSGGGGVMLLTALEADFSFDACRFLGNEAGHAGAVGAQVSLASTLTFTACEFTENVAGGHGGAVLALGPHPLAFIDCEFDGNTAGAYGEGGAVSCDYVTLRVQTCTFRNNVAHFGGAVWVEHYANIADCVFEQNTAVYGGAVCSGWFWESAAVIADSLFRQNTAQHGGGLYHGGRDISLQGCSFIENMATELTEYGLPPLGGGAYLDSGKWMTSVRDCVFTRNVAVGPEDAAGGALYCNSDGAVVTGCSFEENSASHYGGAMSFWWGMPELLHYDCVFQRNAARYGGAISVESGNPQFVQCIFRGNVASQDGGAAYNGRPFFINCAMFANIANGHGGGIFGDEYARPKVWNTILWNNEDQDGTGESSQVFGGIPRIRFSCIQGWTGQLEGIATFGDDPLFVDPLGPDGIPGTDDDDLRLSAGSPCIDRGCNWLVEDDWGDLDGDGDTGEFLPLDLDGEGRFFDDPNTPDNSCGAPVVDLGPYEVGGTGPQPCRGDVDGDGRVGLPDLACLLSSYGTEHPDPDYNSVCDFDGWGQVDLDDLATLLSVYGTHCE